MKIISGYAKSFDGTDIWYKSSGEGLPLIFCNGLGVSIFFWKYIELRFREFCRVVLWDYRGHCRSGMPNSEDYTMSANAKDLLAVMDKLNIKKAVMGGHSMGVQVIFEFYRLFPDRVLGLIPILGPYEHPANTFLNLPEKLINPLFYRTYNLVMKRPRFAKSVWNRIMRISFAFNLAKVVGRISPKLYFINPDFATEEDFRPYFEHLRFLDITVFFKMAKCMQEHSAADILEKIKVPTLIIAGEYDIFTPAWVSQKMKELIPNSEILVIKKGSHGALVEQPELMNLRIEKFIKTHFSVSE